MKRLLLLTLAIAIAISVVAVMGVRSLGGSTDVAYADTPPEGAAYLALDLVQDTGWCNTIDSAITGVATGTVHYAAVCLVGATTSATDFGLVVNYDSTKNLCEPVATHSAKGLNDNPDFVGDNPSPAPGDAGYDCSNSGLTYPTCGGGTSYLGCNTTDASQNLTGNWAVAVIKFTASGTGVDTLSFGTTALYDSGGSNLVRCPATDVADDSCLTATVTKVGPPTNTPLPPTNTPRPTNTPAPPTLTPTPPAHPPECDIGELGPIELNPSSLFMKVGDAPAIVDMTDTWKNFGAFTPLGVGATCSVGFAMGAEAYGLPTDGPIPPGISVRVEPKGVPIQFGGGDVCLACDLTNPAMIGKPISTCLLGSGALSHPEILPWTFTALPCDEVLSAYPMSLINGSCEDGIDQADSEPGCDWAGFSKACTPATTPDPLCVDIPSIGIQPLVRWTATVGSTKTVAREIKVQCNAPGVYPLVIFGSSTQATGAGGALDPNPANDTSYGLLNVVCAAEMNKDCDVLTEGIQTSCNLWLMNPKFAGGVEFGTNPPITLPPADANGCVVAEKGKGCLAVDVWLTTGNGDLDDTNDADLIPECTGAWEHQIRYDHKIVRFVDDLNPITVDTNGDTVADSSWLESTGRIANCTATILAENWILEGCTTVDDPAEPGMQVGPCGTGVIERMLIIPQTQDLIYRGVFRPTKDNGVVTNIVDDNCEVTDIYAEPFANTLAGGLTPVCGNLTITVRMLEGDLDLDCDVDVKDDQAIAFRYGSSWGLQLYDQWYDLEPKYADQDIDIKDLQFVFGRNYSTCQHPIPDDQSIPVAPGQPDP